MEEMEVGNKERSHELKHLGFVRVAAIQVLVCASNLYEYAKTNAGPLRSTVGTVEGAVAAAVGPVYEKFKGVPVDLLVFFDKKVDEATHKFDKHAPPTAKKIACQAHELIQKASQKGCKLVHEAQTKGLRAAVHSAATDSKEVFLSQSVKVWVKLNEVQPLHNAVEIAVPTAAHWSKKYNHTVEELSRKGYTVFGYLPLVPVDEIAKTFKKGEAEKQGDDKKSSSGSDSD